MTGLIIERVLPRVGVIDMQVRNDKIPISRARRAFRRRYARWLHNTTQQGPHLTVQFKNGYWLAEVKRRHAGAPKGVAKARFRTEREAWSWALMSVVVWQRHGLSATGNYYPKKLMDYPLSYKDRMRLIAVRANFYLSAVRFWEVN